MDDILSSQDAIQADLRTVEADLRAHGVDVPRLVHIVWEEPHLDALPVLYHWLREPLHPHVKRLILNILLQKWAFSEAFPVLLKMFDDMKLPMPDAKKDSHYESLVWAICSAPNSKLWPRILDIARREDLGSLRGIVLERAGKFKTHADEVLELYSEFVGSDLPFIEIGISEGLRHLGDPRGVAILHQVRDLNSSILRSKAKTLDRLAGR